MQITTSQLELAAKFVNNTASHIFLTGKAGTGKTTFLHNLAQLTHKRFVIVAPTGIAALNAGGTTIHSQFLLPLGSFLTGNAQPNNDANFYGKGALTKKHNLNSRRKQVLRSIDLLIIDEVSMLRADILDAIDYRLQQAKGNFNTPFGGVQLLLIGDLYQLPPIVKDHEWSVLRQNYASMHFFESMALKDCGYTYIELDKIFRQQDGGFIKILNNLRNNVVTPEDIEILNKHYVANFDPESEEVVTITTHNYKADNINQLALEKLPGKPEVFHADVKGDFPDSIFPVLESLSLKVGAQIMFVKNDSVESKYFNGKLAKVIHIDKDEITVKFLDNGQSYILKEDAWENKKYKVNETTKETEEEVVGTFKQYPVKLAWAITVHKSQGLTFDRAVIDVGAAFAPGQVYVALSRLRSLEGLVLRTRIVQNAISSDADVVKFAQSNLAPEALPDRLVAAQTSYIRQIIDDTYDFASIFLDIENHQRSLGSLDFEDEEMRNALDNLKKELQLERENSIKFKNQLQGLLHFNELEKLHQRIEKGSGYYAEIMWRLLRDLNVHMAYVHQFSRTKTYLDALDEIDLLLMKKLSDIEKASYISRCILSGTEIQKLVAKDEIRKRRKEDLMREVAQFAIENPKNSSRKTGKKRQPAGAAKQKKEPKGSTQKTSITLKKDGMSISEIAAVRGFAESTIEGHLAKGIKEGDLHLEDVLEKDVIRSIKEAYKTEGITMGGVYEKLSGNYTYGQIRMVQAHLETLKEEE